MASEGPLSPSTGADDAAVGTRVWNSPASVSASDNARAQTNFGETGTSHYLKATGFGFSIPAGSTIDGIIVQIERSAGSGTIVDSEVKLVKGGTVQATNKASASSWPATDTYTTYGSSSDLWGTTWSATDINASDFGVVLSVTLSSSPQARVDHVRATVHYTAAVPFAGWGVPI